MLQQALNVHLHERRPLRLLLPLPLCRLQKAVAATRVCTARACQVAAAQHDWESSVRQLVVHLDALNGEGDVDARRSTKGSSRLHPVGAQPQLHSSSCGCQHDERHGASRTLVLTGACDIININSYPRSLSNAALLCRVNLL